MPRFLTALASATLVAAACGGGGGGGSTGGSDKAPIVIAASYSKTGAYASSGTSVANGYQVAVDEINKGGGVLGRQIKLILEDDASDPANVVRLYTRFTSEDKVDALLSPYGSALGGAAVQLSERAKTPMAHSQTSSPTVFKETSYQLQAGILPSTQVLAGVPTLAKSLGFNTVALGNSDLDAFIGICDGVAAAVKSAGMEVVTRQQYAKATSDFSNVALKLKQGNPDVVVECSAVQDSIGLTRALPQAGLKPKMLVSATGDDPAFQPGLGPLANHAIGYTAWSGKLTSSDSTKFAQAYQTRIGSAANGQAAGAYATVKVLAAGIQKANSTDKEKVNKALHQLSLPTILGPYKVDASGVQQGYKALLVQWQDGNEQIIFPENLATAKVQTPY